jgi:hypothetical protein
VTPGDTTKDLRLTKEERELVLEHRREAEELAKAEWEPRTCESYSAEEKLAWFQKMHEMAQEEYITRYHDEHGMGVKDMSHWMFEAVMDLLGDDVWKHMS